MSEHVVETTREIIKSVLEADKSSLKKSDFVNSRFDESTWQLFI